MTENEARAQSAKKVGQIQELMKALQVEVACKKRITSEGFIEEVVMFIDKEAYNLVRDETNEGVANPDTHQVASAEKEKIE